MDENKLYELNARIERYPTFILAYFDRALFYLKNHRHVEALNDFKKVKELFITHPDPTIPEYIEEAVNEKIIECEACEACKEIKDVSKKRITVEITNVNPEDVKKIIEKVKKSKKESNSLIEILESIDEILSDIRKIKKENKLTFGKEAKKVMRETKYFENTDTPLN